MRAEEVEIITGKVPYFLYHPVPLLDCDAGLLLLLFTLQPYAILEDEG
jgi:hypothetical protein